MSRPRFAWRELATPDVAASRSFYETVFGWTWHEHAEGPSGSPYWVGSDEGGPVAAVNALRADEQAHGVPAHWHAYLDVDDPVALAVGGPSRVDILVSPFATPLHGTMFAVSDPTGAVLLVRGHRHDPAVSGRELPHELRTSDVELARRFYRDWLGELPGGVVELSATARDMGAPSHWLTVFESADLESSRRAVEGAGGRQLSVGASGVAVLADQFGAVFGIRAAASAG